ncbi:MAG: hypothetical protein ABIR32_02090, partial [Ilumatobacteraceae bacterium]
MALDTSLPRIRDGLIDQVAISIPVRVGAASAARPEASTLNVTFAGQHIANLAIVPLGADGRVSLFSQSGAHLLADVAGWFTDTSQSASTAGLFVPLDPAPDPRHADRERHTDNHIDLSRLIHRS